MSDCGLEDYEIEDFIVRLGSMPIERIAFEDRAGSYEMRQASVYKLENGQFATIVEEGCSCYSRTQADIELFASVNPAMEKFELWKKEHQER